MKNESRELLKPYCLPASGSFVQNAQFPSYMYKYTPTFMPECALVFITLFATFFAFEWTFKRAVHGVLLSFHTPNTT